MLPLLQVTCQIMVNLLKISRLRSKRSKSAALLAAPLGRLLTSLTWSLKRWGNDALSFMGCTTRAHGWFCSVPGSHASLTSAFCSNANRVEYASRAWTWTPRLLNLSICDISEFFAFRIKRFSEHITTDCESCLYVPIIMEIWRVLCCFTGSSKTPLTTLLWDLLKWTSAYLCTRYNFGLKLWRVLRCSQSIWSLSGNAVARSLSSPNLYFCRSTLWRLQIRKSHTHSLTS